MNLRPWGEKGGYNISLKEAQQREGQESRKFYFEPKVLADLINGSKFNQGVVEIHPKYGLSIIIGYRPEKKPGEKPDGGNRHEP